jgi:hypothetical protein
MWRACSRLASTAAGKAGLPGALRVEGVERFGEGVSDAFNAVAKGLELGWQHSRRAVCESADQPLAVPAQYAHGRETVRPSAPRQAMERLPQLRQRGTLSGRHPGEEAAQLLDPLPRVGKVLSAQRAKLLRKAVVWFG